MTQKQKIVFGKQCWPVSPGLKNTRLDQGESNGQIFLDIIESNKGKDNREHSLEIGVRSQANKYR